MSSLTWVLVAVTATAMPINWWSVWRQRVHIEEVAKPAATIGLIAVAATAEVDPSSLQPLIVAALIFGLLGDIVLLPRVNQFLAGLGAFLIGHVLYVVALGSIWAPNLLLIAGIAGLVALAWIYVIPIDTALRSSSMRVPVGAYIAISCAVVVVGAGTGRWLIAVGALSFATSDGLIGINKFVTPAPQRRWIIQVLYHCGQAAILAGTIAG